MTQTAKGQICFGIVVSFSAQFPWSAKRWRGPADWWTRGVCGYKPSILVLPSGKIAGGVEPTQEMKDAYYAEKMKFIDEHPLPFELVNFNSDELPMWILAVPGTVTETWRGFPMRITENNTVGRGAAALIEFCDKYDIEIGDNIPEWYLTCCTESIGTE